MENQLAKTENKIMALKNEPRNMTGCLMNAMETGDQQLVKTLLKPFQSGAGLDFLMLAKIPSGERIPALAKENKSYVHKFIVAQIEYTMKFFNLSNSLSVEQIFLLADQIIDEAGDDNISLQDVFIFLQKLATGKMGVVYNRLDIPSVMEMFDKYRDERVDEIIKIKEEIHINHKASGDPTRWSENQDREKKLNHNAMADYLKTKYNGQI